jgi:hypothetical protein
MCKKHMPVTDRQRGSDRVVKRKGPSREPQRGRLSWFCNPLVLKAGIATARIIYELLRIFFPRH